MNNVRIYLKNKLNQFAEWYRVHERKKDWVRFAALHTRERILSKQQTDQAKKFYEPYCKINPIFFEFYREKTGEFSPYFLPDDIYYGYVDPYFNDWTKAKHMDNKCFYASMFQNVRQPDTIFLRINGIWFDADHNFCTKEKMTNVLEKENNLFVKIATESDGGHGVWHYNDAKDIGGFWDFVSARTADIIVQKGVEQHERLNCLNSSSVNTIRVISLLRNSEVKIYSSVLRMGVNGCKVDNEASGGRTCGICADGRLKPVGYNKYGECCLEHPDSHIAFYGYLIPGFNKVLDVVPMLHRQVPHFRLVSWDFAVDQDSEPVLIEANFKYGGVTIHQLNNGPVFGEDTECILAEVFDKRRRVRKR